MGRAWSSSQARHVVSPIAGSLPDPEVIRLIGYVGLGAIMTRVVIVGPGELLQESAVGVGWLIAAPFAVCCIVRPAAVATAWKDWRAERLDRFRRAR
jgi:hypothetical protein